MTHRAYYEFALEFLSDNGYLRRTLDFLAIFGVFYLILTLNFAFVTV